MDFTELLQRELAALVEGTVVTLPRIGLGSIVFFIGYLLTRLIRRAIVRAIQNTPAGLAAEHALARVVMIVGVTLAAVSGVATMHG